MKYKVVEHFVSINGEGRLAGELALFIRFKGCNLRCSYCDTMWANQADTPYTEMTKEELYGLIREAKTHNVTITGGEPLLQENIYELLEFLSEDRSLNVEIETNGSIDISNFLRLDNPPSFTLDYKLPSSGMEKEMNLDNYAYLKEKDVIKFVAGSMADLEIMKSVIDKYSLIDKCTVYISTVFNQLSPADVVEYMKANKLNKVKLQLQMHKFIWHPDQIGV